MSFYSQVVKEFNSYPHTVAKAAELLAKGDYVCVLLGDGVRSPQLGTIPTSVQ
jgi:hypothetical protein